MNKYESMYILEADREDEVIAQQVEKFTQLVVENGGTIQEVKPWGKRRLAYPIQDKIDGYYVLMTFEAPAELPQELERNFKIDENVLRYLVIRLDEKNA
jgi:small subunit ribosomal protein S6